VATHSTLFAASIAGAPLTDFTSFMGQIHWTGGTPESDHWETGQARMQVPYWEDPIAHERNSPIHNVQNMTTPLLLAHGNKDGTVEFFQSTSFTTSRAERESRWCCWCTKGKITASRSRPIARTITVVLVNGLGTI